MIYETVTLNDVSEKIDYGLTTSATLSDTSVKFLRITDIQENGVDWQSVPFCECNEKDFKQYSLARGDIVFARTGATTGKSFLIKDTPGKTVFASYLIRVRANQELVNPEFLSYFFQTPQYWRQISDSAVGAAQVGVNGSKLAELKLPLPPLTEQKRIASLLARADRLRSLRRTARDLGDSLLQSVFLEMFGEPKVNPKKWDVEAIGELVKPTKQINTKSLGLSEFWYIDITSIDRQNKTIVEPKLLDIEDAPSRARKQISANDILVSTVRPNLNAVAKVPQYLDNQIASTGFCVLRADAKKMTSEYLFAIVQSEYFVEHLVKNETGANYPAVSDAIILDTPIPIPPLSQQEEFASVVRRVEQMRARQAEGERQAQGLFESLLSEAFEQ